MTDYQIKDGILTIPEGVTVISEGTFSRNQNIIRAVLPESLKIIGKGAFYGCRNLKEIIFPEQLISIGNGAFNGCSELKSLRIPDSVNHIGIGAFRWCEKLENVILPDSLTVLRKKVFSCCLNLEHITILESVVKIEEKAFHYANLKEIAIPEVCCIKKKAFSCNTKLERIIISEKLNEVCASAFKANIRLKEIICHDMHFSFSEKFRTDEIISVIIRISKFLQNPENPELSAYLAERFRIVISVCNAEILKELLLSGKIFTKNNIDASIQYANQTENYEYQLLLMDYKAQHIGYQNISDKLKL
ncbi:MAG: leucine-rich repeat domain-containing protein [Oscillospiraceae bacterium]|nr:leucine-rich repeat domain-containing protein [Oscillospiraceae bacterium]